MALRVDPMTSVGWTRYGWGACFALVLLVGASYWPALYNDFVFDDRPIVLDNKLFRQGQWHKIITVGYWEGALGGNSAAALTGLYRPLTTALLALQFHLFASNPTPYHAVSIVLHSFAVLLLFRVARRYLSSTASWIAAAAFALHPANSEAVNAVVGQADLVVVIAGLTALLTFDQVRTERFYRRAFVTAILLFAAQMAKESGIVFAVALLLRCASTREIRGATVIIALGGTAIALVFRLFALDAFWTAGIGFIDNPLAYTDPIIRLINGAGICLRYIATLAFPWPLSSDYSFDAIPVIADFASIDFWAPLITLGSLVIATTALWRLSPTLRAAASWLWVGCVSLMLISHLWFPIGTIFAERLIYLPSITFCLLIGWSIDRAANSSRGSIAKVALFGILMTSAVLTMSRTRIWSDDYSLFLEATKVNAGSARSHFGLGLALHRRGEVSNAIQAYDLALTVYPYYAEAHYNRGAALVALERWGEAMAAYRDALRSRPEFEKAERALELLIDQELTH